MAFTDPATGTTERTGRLRSILLTWVPTILFNIALPLITYSLLRDRGFGEVPALLISGVWPVLETILSLVVHHKLDEFSVIVLIFMALSVVVALGFNSPRLLIVKETAVNGLFGVVILASLLAPRPLMFYFGRHFGTDGTPEGVARWNALWQYPLFRHSQRVISAVWGTGLTIAALVQIGLSYLLSFDTMVVVSNLLPIAVWIGLVAFTVTYARHTRAKAGVRQPA